MDPTPSPDPNFLHTFERDGARGLATSRGFRRGEVVCAIPQTARRRRPTRLTVQVGDDEHVEVGGLATLNHSCDPNVRLDVERMEVVAERDIEPGEELTFFYPSTEWEMAEPFDCACGGPRCVGVVRGARDLPAEVLDRYFVNAHVRRRAERID
ncbi:MAG TPA: SET domain-containing protein-lysine N-methyltransferase [Gemmatimonadota bacterium]|nr:SET domain-containing protein-lysine N-methyltransferase [Gemmatimonadota bacterium]